MTKKAAGAATVTAEKVVDILVVIVEVLSPWSALHTMSESQVLRWRRVIRNIAGHWVMRWAGRQPLGTLIDDLEPVGWEVVLTLGPYSPRLPWELQNRIQDEICRWLYGVSRGQRPRRWTEAVPLANYAGVVIDPGITSLEQVQLRQTIERIWDALPDELQELWLQMGLNLHRSGKRYVTSRLSVLCREKGWSAKQIHRRKQKLMRLAKAAVKKTPPP